MGIMKRSCTDSLSSPFLPPFCLLPCVCSPSPYSLLALRGLFRGGGGLSLRVVLSRCACGGTSAPTLHRTGPPLRGVLLMLATGAAAELLSPALGAPQRTLLRSSDTLLERDETPAKFLSSPIDLLTLESIEVLRAYLIDRLRSSDAFVFPTVL